MADNPASNDSGILYVVVARNETPLAEYSAVSGNFPQVSRTILERLPPDDCMSYKYGEYWVRYLAAYSGACRLVLLCVCGEASAEVCFRFLEAVRQRAEAYAWLDATANSLDGALQGELGQLVAKYNSRELNTVTRVREQIAEIKEYAEDSIEKIIARNDKIELLIDKTTELNDNSVVFRREARTLRRHLCWRNCKQMVCLVVLFVCIGLGLWVYACGWDFCLSNDHSHHKEVDDGQEPKGTQAVAVRALLSLAPGSTI